MLREQSCRLARDSEVGAAGALSLAFRPGGHQVLHRFAWVISEERQPVAGFQWQRLDARYWESRTVPKGGSAARATDST